MVLFNRFAKISFLCILLNLCFEQAHSQDSPLRPRVGLVLSGGGAHGIAHLGVLKVMEEAGLRPDCISGVSMGSIVGGMYALGYSTDSILSILKSIDWGDALSNRIPENKVIFLEKEFIGNSILSLPLSKNKIMLPSGLINGQVIENTLSYYAWPAADINDFSKLPIPFTCLAADLISFRKIELNKGYLPDAIRASSSVPSIFTPLKSDSLLLVDGGLLRNFAASEVINMGANIVIGSYTGFEAYNEDELQSVSGILKQIAMFRSHEDFGEQKKLVNHLIVPNTAGLSISAFQNVDSIYMRGYKAALPSKEYFRKLADSLNHLADQKPLENIMAKNTYSFDKIEVAGNKSYSDQQIQGILDIEPGDIVNREMLTNGIELLYGKAWFDKVKYRIVPRNDSLILQIDCIEKPEAMLYGSVRYDNNLLFGLKLGISMKNVLSQRSAININSLIANYYRVKADFLQFIDINQKFGMSVMFYTDKTLIPMMQLGGDRGEVKSRYVIPGLSLSKRIGLNNMMSLNLSYEDMELLVNYDSDVELQSISNKYLTATYDYQLNTLDRKHFPDKGTVFNISAGTSKLRSAETKTDTSEVVYRNGQDQYESERFYTLRGSIIHYYSPGRKLTFAFGGEALFLSGSDPVSDRQNFYLMGGIESLNKRSIPMTGFHANEILVRKAAGFRSDFDFEFLKDLHLNISADIFALEELESSDPYTIRTGIGIGAGYLSAIGPMRIGVMYGNHRQGDYFNNLKGFISIGYRF
jgi:NTE family protein